jgi:hypothetical protein
MEITVAYRIFIILYSLLKSDRLSTKSKLTLHEARNTSQLTYPCQAWEFEADIHLTKLQRLKNKVLRVNEKCPRKTPDS